MQSLLVVTWTGAAKAKQVSGARVIDNDWVYC